jgi:hypothetical protein
MAGAWDNLCLEGKEEEEVSGVVGVERRARWGHTDGRGRRG